MFPGPCPPPPAGAISSSCFGGPRGPPVSSAFQRRLICHRFADPDAVSSACAGAPPHPSACPSGCVMPLCCSEGSALAATKLRGGSNPRSDARRATFCTSCVCVRTHARMYMRTCTPPARGRRARAVRCRRPERRRRLVRTTPVGNSTCERHPACKCKLRWRVGSGVPPAGCHAHGTTK